MACIEGGSSEAVLICAIDLFTGEVLMNFLVEPWDPILEWCGHINGIIPSSMSIAVTRRQALDGREAAREEPRKHVNEYTVLVE